MAKRLLDYSASDYLSATPMQLKQAILASEGRTIMAENVPSFTPLLNGVTNAELERAAGADLILFNVLNVLKPFVSGIPDDIPQSESVHWIKKAVGRAIGVNLEPVDPDASMAQSRTAVDIGRIASPKTFQAAEKLGLDFVCLTGNPGTGVSNDAIKRAIGIAHKNYNGLIIAGKMHGAGVTEPVMTLDIAKDFIAHGIDILLVPAPYTVPFFTENNLHEIAEYIRDYNIDKPIEEKVLLLTANGTSQDSSDEATIRKIALASKANGADIQHIGDSFNGVCLPENLYTLGEVIRGKRHHLTILAKSSLR